MKIADCHADLLSYLEASSSHSLEDDTSRASLPFMKAGQVKLQVFPIFTKTEKGSSQKGVRQYELFKELKKQEKDITFFLSIENGSGFCAEEEPLAVGLRRLEEWAEELVYISLTWNGENRFGGGCGAHVGLKEDGKALLRWMNGKKIALDFSHTSDRLAYELLDFMDKEDLEITPLASHSNFREVVGHRRNLPDDIAKEIVKRGGVIGLNFVRPFLGADERFFLKHIEHARKLGVLHALCLGADFFDDREISPELEPMRPLFIPGFDNSSCYPRLIKLLRVHLSVQEVESIAYATLHRFIHR